MLSLIGTEVLNTNNDITNCNRSTVWNLLRHCCFVGSVTVQWLRAGSRLALMLIPVAVSGPTLTLFLLTFDANCWCCIVNVTSYVDISTVTVLAWLTLLLCWIPFSFNESLVCKWFSPGFGSLVFFYRSSLHWCCPAVARNLSEVGQLLQDHFVFHCIS